MERRFGVYLLNKGSLNLSSIPTFVRILTGI